MSYVNPIWLEGRRKYWQRHDWQRYLTPAGLAEHQRAEEEAKLAARRKAEAAAHKAFEAEVREMRTLVDHLKSYLTWRRAAQRSTVLWPQADRALERFNLAYARYFGEDKAGFNPDQPRMPAGNPDGGQWSKEEGGGDAEPVDDLSSTSTEVGSPENTPTDISAARKAGHHYLPQGVYKKRRLSDETRQVFEETTTGPLQNKRLNTFSKEHRDYNEAADQLFDQFLRRKGITEEQMTPDHARQLLGEVITSKDSRIQRFNQRIWMHRIFRGGRFRGNE